MEANNVKTSETTGKLATNEAAAQAELGVAIMDKKNPHFKSDYLSHKGAVEVILPTYAKHGISITQCFRISGDILILDTRFTDKSGEWRESEYPVCKFPERPQTIAANGTYAKRLSLVAMACLAADVDDDGNEANKTQIHAPRKAGSSEEASKEILDALLLSIEGKHSVEEIDKWVADNMQTIKRMLPEHKDELREEISAYKKDLA
jgi:hypothetical protein